MVLLEILFVRHGLSCANVWSSRFKPTAMLYPDPELTHYGIDLCVERKPVLEDVIRVRFGDDQYSIGSSCMIRAQMTAYYQLASDKSKPIHILPHIAETGSSYAGTPLSPDKQAPLLGPEILAKLGVDARGDVSHAAKSNWPLFLEWVNRLGAAGMSPFFTPVVKDGTTVYRAVIFTHSRFLEKIFGTFPQNNDVLFARIDAESGTILEYAPMTSFPRLTDARGQSLEGCRFQTSYQTMTGTPVRVAPRTPRVTVADAETAAGVTPVARTVGGKRRTNRKIRKTRRRI
jgi:hypothetical protein